MDIFKTKNQSIEYEGDLIARAIKLIPIWIQLGLLALVIVFFQIEADLGLTVFFPWMCVGFLAHALVPLRFRPIILFAFFVGILSLFVGEWGTSNVLGTGFLMLGICHLPIALFWRKLLAVAFGIVLALMTLGDIPSLLNTYQLRIITTLLMFRTILYLHELAHEKERVDVWQRINYFFILPNIVLPLFPIVDYKKHKQTYYNSEATKIYQSGVNLILWSLLCVLMYRLLYHFIIPNQLRLDGVQEVMIYVVATYLTVIRLVGLLTLAVGVLRLFGYNLPNIFNYMFFASSFSDLFRRINIYWKDFLMKICYYPTYFRVRKRFPSYALTIATLVTFFFTWFFHVYQWFWVLGTNPLSETGMIYWGIFGIVATLNTLTEHKSKRPKPKATFGYVFSHTLKVFTTFFAMALLYSIWMAPTFTIWMSMIVTALRDSWINWMYALSGILFLYLLCSFLYLIYLKNKTSLKNIWDNIQSKNLVRNTSILTLIIALSFVKDYDEKLNLFVKNNEFNHNDINTEYSGYYDEILALNNDVSSRIWGRDYTNKGKRMEEKLEETDIVRAVDNVLAYEFVPNAKGKYCLLYTSPSPRDS